MKRIWLLRHAESRAQSGEEIGIDSPLSELGILQAERLNAPLAGIRFDAAFISPLKRARQTYEHSGLCCDKVIFDSRLIEETPSNAYASLLPYEDLPAYGSADSQNAWTIDAPLRAKSFLDDLMAAEAIARALVISHAGLLSILFQSLIPGLKADSGVYLGTNNCGISSLILNSGKNSRHTLLFWNDISHVRKELDYDPMAQDLPR